MSKAKAVLVMVVVAIAGGVLAVQCLSQEREQGGGRRGGRFDPERMRQMYLERVKTTLGATDEEWKVLAPRIEKVQGLSMQLRAGGRMFGGRGARGDRPQGATAQNDQPQREQSEVEKAATALREVLEKESATAEDIAKKLTALREAREKVKQELAAAQEDLRKLLTARQEAQLVLMGMLD